ncbi:hypothetical protein [Kribbella jiaozuonensis]|uniref:Uncharacterized protein n=1 Tax=Kribbella jiaozuonensis TaxID=2575441 RepID=A0A4U3LVW0_9ACTN|nr:hypothetical protein [Kribbella jiaozuonensis]TKK80251.1 hypothetical protein FDA38_18165 [Kribbella jiaozuonensis]
MKLRILGILTGIALVAAALTAWVLIRQDPTAAAPAPVAQIAWGRTTVDADGLAARSGVRLTQVAVTGGGGLLDLRFQVLDPNRANSLHDASTPPAVIDETSGLVVRDLLMSHAHTGKFTTGETYYLVFENPGNWIRRGSNVTVLLGQAQVEHVVVR